MTLIRIGRNNNRVFFGFDTGMTDDSILWFENDRGSEMNAMLLVRFLEEKMDEKMREIRKESYLRGWQDRGKKAAKETWFNGGLP